jgi:pyruvate formate lyase activating enzyme
MKQAYLYQQLKPRAGDHQGGHQDGHKEDRKVKCNLCRHGCTLGPGKKGLCGVRQNQAGLLYSLNYGKAIAANIDPVEKKPLYHFLPGSKIFSIGAAGCNFRCDFCQNWQSSQITKGEGGRVVGQDFPPAQVVQSALKHECPGIAYTYTEPTVFYEYAKDTAELARKQGLKNIFVTNGYQSRQTIDDMAQFIDAANVDLKAFNDDYYRQVCGAKLEPVLDSICHMHQQGIWLELTTLIVPGQNDDPDELQSLAEFIADLDTNIPWHISRFTPRYKMSDLEATPRKTLEQAAQLGQEAGLNYIYVGNVAWSKYRDTLCPECESILIDRSGYRGQASLDKNKCPQCGYEIAGVF